LSPRERKSAAPPEVRAAAEPPVREAAVLPPPLEAAARPPDRDPAPGMESGTPRGRQTVTIKLARFEGPLDLLLHLIKRDEIDIYDIPIAHITQQYLAYLELMRILDLEVAGEFLVMAATLMRIKAKMLLPLPALGEEGEEEGDPREELVQRLVEYRQFKEAAGTLKTRESERRLLFTRGMTPGEDEAGPLPLAATTLFDLLDALNRVMSRLSEQAVYEVEGEVYDVEEKMALIASLAAEQGRMTFESLLLRCHARLEIIKLGRIAVVQSEHFGAIQIEYRPPEGSEPHASDKPAVRD
jgi:segregation and condensation protein A